MKQYIINKWSGYESLKKDLAIIKYFINHKYDKLRQKTIIEHFSGKITPKTVREHLYKLVKLRIIEEDVSFPGTYQFLPSGYKDIGVDMDRILRILCGDLYEIAVSIYKDKHQYDDEEPEIENRNVEKEYLEDYL